MKRILDVASMRASDAATIAGGTSGRELMRRAGEGIFRAARWKAPAAVVCGKGNNGGDGFVLAALLWDAGIPCEIFLQAEEFSPEGRFFFEACRERGIPVRQWRDTETLAGFGSVADCIFGTGFRGEAAGEAARMIGLINGSGAFVVSADINSGLGGDSGLAGAETGKGDAESLKTRVVRSDLTVSVGFYQPGHFLNMAMDLMGEKTNIDIGIRPQGPARFLMEAEDAARLFPPRKHFAHKGTYGYLGLIGGSERYPGALRLAAAANAAMRAGAGVVKAAVPRSLLGALTPLILESTLFPLGEEEGRLAFRREEWEELIRGLKCVSLGMGLGNSPAVREGIAFLAENYRGTLILDADGLNALSEMGARGRELLRGAKCRVILTPHPGEFARLTGRSMEEIQAEGLRLAEEYARDLGATVLLKGPATIVTDGDRTWITDRGAPGMATAGSGDVLSGILAALCAGEAPAEDAAAAGAWLNGRAGEIAQEKMGAVSMTAGDTVAALPSAIRELEEIRRGDDPG